MGEEVQVTVEESSRRKRKKDVNEEGFEVGRLVGVIARKDPELYERLKSYAEASGYKFTDMVYEALILYDEYLQLSAVDAKSLMVALRLLDHLFKRLLQMMMTLNQFFTTEFFQQQIDIMHQIQQQRQQQLAAMEKQERQSKQQEVKAKLIEMTLNTMMAMLGNLMTTLTGTMAKQQIPTQQLNITPSTNEVTKGVKIVRGKSSK